MKASGFNAFMARVDAAEYGLCRRLNRGASFALPRRVFQVASRLGDGIIWYVARSRCCRCSTAAGAEPGARHGAHRAAGLVLYSVLKRIFVRERPFITHAAITRGGAAGSLQLSVRPHAARRVVHLAGERALPGARLGAGAAGGPDRRLARGARAALSDGRAGRGALGAALARGLGSAIACTSALQATGNPARARPVHLGRLFPARQRRLHLHPHLPPGPARLRRRDDAGRAATMRPSAARAEPGIMRVAGRRRAAAIRRTGACAGARCSARCTACRAATSTWCTSTRRSSRTTPACASRARTSIPCVATYHTFFEEYLHHYVPLAAAPARARFSRAPSRARSARRCRRSSRLPSRCARCCAATA